MARIARWPLRNVLLAYLERMKEAYAEQHRINMLIWASKTAFGGKVKPPAIPPLLR